MQDLSLDYLYSNLFLGLLVNGLVYCAKCTFSEHSLELVMLRVCLAVLKFAKVSFNKFPLVCELGTNFLDAFVDVMLHCKMLSILVGLCIKICGLIVSSLHLLINFDHNA